MLRHINEKKLCSLVCLLILITHVDRAYGGVIITLRFEFSTPPDMQIYYTGSNPDGISPMPWEGFWEREIDFDSADYDPYIGIAYADLQRVEDSYTSSTQPFLNYVDRAQDLTTASLPSSHLYMGFTDFSQLDTSYKTLNQSSIQYAPALTGLSFTFDPPDPNDPPGGDVSYWSSALDTYVNPDASQEQIRVRAVYNNASFGASWEEVTDSGVNVLDAWSIKTSQAQAVPEPSTAIAIGLLGIVGFAGNRRRRRQVSAA